jgi:hypothetical protein
MKPEVGQRVFDAMITGSRGKIASIEGGTVRIVWDDGYPPLSIEATKMPGPNFTALPAGHSADWLIHFARETGE